MTNKKVILRLSKVFESPGPGVMEYWSVDKKAIICSSSFVICSPVQVFPKYIRHIPSAMSTSPNLRRELSGVATIFAIQNFIFSGNAK